MNFAKYKYTKKNGITKDGHTMFEQDIVSDLNRKSHLEEQLQQYKSIVKAVDPDNLPKCEVIAIDSTKEFITSDGLWLDTFGTVWAGNEIENIGGITHYIETKDIIKMMGDL